METSHILGLDPQCHSIAFGRDDDNHTCLAAGQVDGNIALFTQAALRQGKGCSHTLRGHQNNWVNWVDSLAFGCSGTEHLLASGSTDRTVRLWDMHTRECVAVLEGHTDSVDSVAFSPDSHLLASASRDYTVRLWDVSERKAAFPMYVLQGHSDWVFSVSFSPDGRHLASASWDRTVRLWNVPEGAPGPVLQHSRAARCVAFSPVNESSMLATGCDDGIIRLWDVSNQQLLRELQGHSNYIRSLAFSPDGSQLVSGSFDCTVRLWSVASGKLLKTMEGHSKYVFNVAFHPNGKQVASCSDDKTLRIWTVCE
jgi:WD40 repeat protein